jgi:hypothetical protein
MRIGLCRPSPTRSGFLVGVTEVAIELVGAHGSTAKLRTNAAAAGVGEVSPLELAVTVVRPGATAGAGATIATPTTLFELPSGTSRPDKSVLKLLQHLAGGKSVDGTPLVRASATLGESDCMHVSRRLQLNAHALAGLDASLALQLHKFDVETEDYVLCCTLTLVVRVLRVMASVMQQHAGVAPRCAGCDFCY